MGKFPEVVCLQKGRLSKQAYCFLITVSLVNVWSASHAFLECYIGLRSPFIREQLGRVWGEAKGSGTTDGPPLKQVRSSVAPEEEDPSLAGGGRTWIERSRNGKKTEGLSFLKYPFGTSLCILGRWFSFPSRSIGSPGRIKKPEAWCHTKIAALLRFPAEGLLLGEPETFGTSFGSKTTFFPKKKKKKKGKLCMQWSQSLTLQGKPYRDSHWNFVDGTHASGHSTNFPLVRKQLRCLWGAEVSVLRKEWLTGWTQLQAGKRRENVSCSVVSNSLRDRGL